MSFDKHQDNKQLRRISLGSRQKQGEKKRLHGMFDVSYNELQMSALESLYISKYQPILCKQNGFCNLLLSDSTEESLT